jgi:nitrogen-specific signal transduction histidine kinase
MPDPTPEELLERFRNTPDEEFVRILVHDLRGPLSGMVMAVKLLNVLMNSDNPKDKERLQNLSEILLHATDKMTLILDTAVEHDRSRRNKPTNHDTSPGL